MNAFRRMTAGQRAALVGAGQLLAFLLALAATYGMLHYGLRDDWRFWPCLVFANAVVWGMLTAFRPDARWLRRWLESAPSPPPSGAAP